MKKIELLAPAGTMEKLKMAIRYGADAVYLAGKSFGLRAYGGNFTLDAMKEAVAFAHERGRKVYVTVNIIPRNQDLKGLDTYLRSLQDVGVDAAIISDLGVFSLAREVAPKLELHVSTQASAANWRAVKAWKELGASRVVLAREVSIEEMKEIRQRVDVELEYFIHGAMCISWSGRCLLSNFFTDGKRQSNRGECIQACRFKYSVVEESRPGQYWPVEEDEHGTYVFNSKDLCLIDEIPALVNAGASSLKIEGRMKSVYYVAAVVAAYRKAIDAYYAEGDHFRVRKEWREELEKISHRPYTTAFSLGAPQNAEAYDKSQPEQSYDFVGLVLDYDEATKTARIEQRNNFKAGDVLECLSPKGDVFPLTIGKMKNKDGLTVVSAPHPLEVLTMETETKLLPYTILRRLARETRN